MSDGGTAKSTKPGTAKPGPRGASAGAGAGAGAGAAKKGLATEVVDPVFPDMSSGEVYSV